MGNVGENEPKIAMYQEVGIGNGKRPPIPLGVFWGVYFSEKHPNKDFALIKLRCYKNGNPEAETLNTVLRYGLEYEGKSKSLVLLPLRFAVPMDPKKGAKVGRRKRQELSGKSGI